MDTDTEAATNIGDIPIMVDAGEQAEAVDDEDISLRQVSMLCEPGIANHLASLQFTDNLLQVILPYHMGCENHLPVRMGIHIRDEDILVRLPTAASNKDLMPTDEVLHDRQSLRCLLDLQHTVEAGVTDNHDIMDTYLGKQVLADLVLHIEMGEALQHMRILPTVPLEEYLTGTEDAADTIDRHLTVLEDMQVVIPELVFDEECHHRMDGPQETAGIGDGVQGKVADDIRSLIILTDLITGGREERQEDLVLRVLLAQLLHQGAALLELTQGGGMKPHILRLRVYLLLQDTDSVTLTAPHLPHLLAEAADDGDTYQVEIYSEVVHAQPRISMARLIR